jgi:PAS domain-containing protein
VATEDVLVVEEALSSLEAAAEGTLLETFVRLRDAGGLRHREARLIAAARRDEGRPAVVVLLRDETVERRLLAELRAHETRLDGLLEHLDDGLVLVADGEDGARVRFANRAFLDLAGLESADVLGAREGDVLRALRGRARWVRRPPPCSPPPPAGRRPTRSPGARTSSGASSSRRLPRATAASSACGTSHRPGGASATRRASRAR